MLYQALALTLGRGLRTGRSALAIGVIWLAPLTACGADYDDIRQHLFHGAHDPGKLAGAVEVRIHSREVEVDATGIVVLLATVVNAKAGHMVPSGSAEAMAYQDLSEIREVEGFAGLKRDGMCHPAIGFSASPISTPRAG